MKRKMDHDQEYYEELKEESESRKDSWMSAYMAGDRQCEHITLWWLRAEASREDFEMGE